jgi:hypothetical protein
LAEVDQKAFPRRAIRLTSEEIALVHLVNGPVLRHLGPGKPRQGREGIHLVNYLIRLSIREYLARPAHLRRRIKVSLILMPIFVGMLPLAPLLMEPMRPVAIGGLLGHLIYGIILGGGLVMVKRRISGVVPAGG